MAQKKKETVCIWCKKKFVPREGGAYESRKMLKEYYGVVSCNPFEDLECEGCKFMLRAKLGITYPKKH
ncbi:MAG: hypothetical protein ACYSWZ_11930 [Planctomycetota bacterium]|jgi:hypothetical protein